jgi:isochorismate hydrolase
MNEAQTQHYTGKQVSDEDRLLDVLKKTSDENEIVLRGVLCKLCCCATAFKAETAQTIHNCYSFPSFSS